jgi:glycerol-3-phosphate cytidylyltransferase-like family protein
MKQIVIMPGGFHPFHAGHMALYNSARKAFPNAEVYVAATNDQSERPFPFAVKEKLAKVAGVEPGHFVQVKSPFQAKEITSHYNPDEDVLIFVRSEKDRNESPKPGGIKKDGSPAYFQPYTGKNMQPFGKHAYFAYLPTVKFGPGITSATEIRNAWPTLNDRRKTAMVMSLYPAAQKNPKLAANIVGMLDQVMGGQQGVAESYDLDAFSGIKFLNPETGKMGTFYYWSSMEGKNEAYSMITNKKLVPAHGDGTPMTWDEYKQALDVGNQGLAEGSGQNNKISFQIQKGKNKFSTTLSVGSEPVGVYQYDANTGRSIAEVYPEFKGKGFGKLLVLDAIYTAAKLGLDFQEDESRTSEYDNVLDSLSSNGYIVDDNGYWYVTGEGEQYLKQSLKQGIAEDKEADPVTNAVLSFYKPVVNDIHKEKLPDYVDQARELLHKTDDPVVRKKLIDIFKEGQHNPYLQGGIITAIAALLGGGAINIASSIHLTPYQTNLMMQGILNSIVPAVGARMSGKNWKDTIKYTLASLGVGVGVAGSGLIEDELEEGFGIPMPGTYEQEHATDQRTRRHHTYDLTSEGNLSKSADYLDEK